MIAPNSQVLLEGPVKLKTWYPYLELSDDEEGKTRWRIVLKTENQETFIILREKPSSFKRMLYAIPSPNSQQTRYTTREEQKRAKLNNLWKERQLTITIKLEDHLRCTFPSVFTHIPLNFAAMMEKPIQNSMPALSKLDLKKKQYESFSVAAALHRAFLRFVAKKIIIGIKKPTLKNRITHITKGIDRNDKEEGQAVDVAANDWGWECTVDTTMRGIKTEYALRSWHEEMFDWDKGCGRYRVFCMSNLRHCWTYEEGVDENGDEVDEAVEETEEVAEEGTTNWNIDDPWWEEAVTNETAQWGNV